MPRAVVCRVLGPPELLNLEEMSPVALQPGQIRIAHRAAGINFPDILMCAGGYQHKPALPFTPGFEAAGEVLEVASDVTTFRPGDRVVAHYRVGGYAEQGVMKAADAWPVPPGLSFEEAACFTTAAVTAYSGLIQRGKLKAGEMLLVLGAGGGVGLTAVEIGALCGATVIAAASSPEKLAAAKARGATHLINTTTEDLRARLKEIAGDRGVDVVYDPVGGDLFEPALRSLAWNGRLLIIGFASGRIPTFKANLALLKGASVVGVRAGEMVRRDPSLAEPRSRQLVAWAAEGHLKPHISHRFPIEQFRDAMHIVADRKAVGRVVLTM